MKNDVFEKRQRDVLYDVKWIRFLKRTWVLRHVPFIEFSVAAGSMALGNVHEDSDFDVIISARRGRIFTVRAFTILFYALLGWRKKKWEHDRAARDKMCLNHFVTEDSYRLSPPYNAYWKALYMHLVPLYGDAQKIEAFFQANADWMGQARHYTDDLRHIHHGPSNVARFLEGLLGNIIGDWFENIQRSIQVRRIKKNISKESGYEPRLIYTDQELEFHPDTERMLLYK